MRIVSLLPSATEILFAIGLGDQVVGITHECDYPPEVRSRMILTRCLFDSGSMSPDQIDNAVKTLAREGRSLYEMNDELLAEADPGLIITQELCHVCALTSQEVERALARLKRKPKVIRVNPKLLDDVFNDMLDIAEAAEARPQAEVILRRLQSRVRKIAPASLLSDRPTVGCIEWLDPLWRCGHWVPEMVRLAGGNEVLAEVGKPSRTLHWEELQQKDPDIVILMPCGYDLGKTRRGFQEVCGKYTWARLRAYQNGQLCAVDANSYFSRPGPRLVDGLELLAEIIHPEYFVNTAPLHSYIRISG